MVRKLNSIHDLIQIRSGESVPKHILYLLYWFAKVINIDYKDHMRLTFDVNSEDYGSHWYGNYEDLLDPVPHGYGYYTIGNLNQDQHSLLPDYVVKYSRGNNRNSARIIVRVQLGGRTTDQVYATQHMDNQSSAYDPYHTYRITPKLIKQLQLLNVGENQMSQLSELLRRKANDWNNQTQSFNARENHRPQLSVVNDYRIDLPTDESNPEITKQSICRFPVWLISLLVFLLVLAVALYFLIKYAS